ncbi:serine/threonine-protein phosphatase 6 regulatory ankyrin repeat subunit B-like [Ochlerotatus camptorhynchus]|uniref:serine/threonine-protein phosphatase 6 regulatory ankyrin repeat subunit B-like n=1 Tax=Ochlerotatus camptorhynchus TaxID=644619 RepID=UPI0031E0DC3E
MHRKRYFPADLNAFPLHYAALRGDTARIRELLSAGHNPHEPIQDGETPLHVAIAGDQVDAAQLLVEEFHNDFQLVQEHLTIKNSECEPDDAFWSSQSILIASGEDQCQRVKQLEASCIPIGNLKDSILVLLKGSIGGEVVAVLDPRSIDYQEVIKLITSLLSNGILSWNSTGHAGNCESLLHLAAYYGNAALLKRLVELGADLTLAGLGKRTPFHAACETSQTQVIELLLTKYLDRFDPTALDENAQHGLHYILNRKNRDSFELVVQKMVEFRVRHFSDTPSAAFNFIFRLENDEWPFTGIWNQLDAAFWDRTIEKVLERYQYDLTYQWKEVAALMDMVTYKKVKSFYSKEICKNPELLNISSSSGFTVLHALVCANELQLVDDLYKRHAQLKKLFERKVAISTLGSIMQQGYIKMLEFVLLNHGEFYLENLQTIIEEVIQIYVAPNYEKAFEVLMRNLPELKASISKKTSKMSKLSFVTSQDFNETYDILLRDFSSIHQRVTRSGESLVCYITANDQPFLNQAIYENRLDLVQQLLDLNINIDHLDCYDRHAIHHVQSTDMLLLIIDRHPDGSDLVNRKDGNGFTLLHILCSSAIDHKQELILELLKLGAKLDETTNDHATVLFYTYDEQLFKFLTDGIESKGFTPVDPNHRDIDGNTALHRHLRQLNSHISSVMLQCSGSFISFNNKGDSYLSYLLRFERRIFDSVFKPVLDANPDKTSEMFEVEFKRSRDRTSQLFVEACVQMNVYCIERFLQMDLDFNAQDGDGTTALLKLLSSDELPSPDLVFNLLEKKVDVNLTNSNRQNALMVLLNKFCKAKEIGYDTRIVKNLIDHGLKLDHVDCEGETALHYCFRNGEFELISLLIENGAVCCKLNQKGKKPYEVAPLYISQIFMILQ